MNLQSGRVPCPKCGRKGVGFALHPHAYGWKDYNNAKCRYCDARFKVADIERAATAKGAT